MTVVVTQSTDEYVRFESVDCVGGKEVPWSDAGNTKCGIAASDVMKYLNEEIWSQLPEDLQAAITPVKRKHKDHEGNVQEYEFKLFLPAAPVVRKAVVVDTARRSRAARPHGRQPICFRILSLCFAFHSVPAILVVVQLLI